MSCRVSTLNAIHSTIAILLIALIAIMVHVLTYDVEGSPSSPALYAAASTGVATATAVQK